MRVPEGKECGCTRIAFTEKERRTGNVAARMMAAFLSVE